MKAYKGFNPDMTCRGFQYKEGETYTEDSASLCNSGFHACEDPLDVLNYYPPTDENGNPNKFHEVELEDVSPEKDSDTKRCAKKITIGAELNLFGLAKAHVEWVKEQKDVKEESAAGYRSAATNTGYRSAATNTGDVSAATNTGDRSAATNTGCRSAATNTGYRSAATNTGCRSAATNTGDRSAATNTGCRSAATNTGDRSAATNTGDRSAATNTGDGSAATNTGDGSAATNTGCRSAATNTGDGSAATNIGYCSAATNTGKSSIAVAWGIDSKAKAAKGSYIALAEWKQNENYEWELVGAKMVKVDGKKIKADTFYKLVNGELVEA